MTMQVASLQAGEGGGGKGEKWYDGTEYPLKHLQVVLSPPRMNVLDSGAWAPGADAAGAALNMNRTSRSCSPHATQDVHSIPAIAHVSAVLGTVPTHLPR